VILHELREFSFAEYISLVKGIKIPRYTFDDILSHHREIAREHITWYSKQLLQDYFQYGQFGYYYEDPTEVIEYRMKMENALKKSLYEDLSSAVDISTHNLSKTADILAYIANTGTSEISIHAISKSVLLSTQTTEIYITFLEDIGLIESVSRFGKITDRLRKSKKWYLANTNLLMLFGSYTGNIRETFFVSQMARIGKSTSFMSHTDFVIAHDG
jgi:uncharacterized protein